MAAELLEGLYEIGESLAFRRHHVPRIEKVVMLPALLVEIDLNITGLVPNFDKSSPPCPGPLYGAGLGQMYSQHCIRLSNVLRLW